MGLEFALKIVHDLWMFSCHAARFCIGRLAVDTKAADIGGWQGTGRRRSPEKWMLVEWTARAAQLVRAVQVAQAVSYDGRGCAGGDGAWGSSMWSSSTCAVVDGDEEDGEEGRAMEGWGGVFDFWAKPTGREEATDSMADRAVIRPRRVGLFSDPMRVVTWLAGDGGRGRLWDFRRWDQRGMGCWVRLGRREGVRHGRLGARSALVMVVGRLEFDECGVFGGIRGRWSCMEGRRQWELDERERASGG